MSTYEISKSSLLSLKAEVLRKQQELSQAKFENDVKLRNLKKNAPLDLKNKGVEERQIRDVQEDADLLKKSRETLELKSKLYEKLSSKDSQLTEAQADYYRRFLVRFDKKKSNAAPAESESEDEVVEDYGPASNPDEEWVEYVDCLGRTRTCLRKDLSHLKSKDKDLREIVDEKRRQKGESPLREKSPSPELREVDDRELLFSQMRREVLRQQWEKEEEVLRDKDNIHYQDVLFNEARSHGVGYYAFSKDEETRLQQQNALRKLREETQKEQKKSEELKAMREKQLKERVRAAENRKLARMGLPPLQDEVEAATPELPKIPEPEPCEDKKLIEKRKKHVRPWDIGKEGVKEHYEHSQEEWVDKKRRERNKEFAPPSKYHKHVKRRREFSPKPFENEVRDEEEPQRGLSTEVAPPPEYDYYRKKPKVSTVIDSVEAGLKYLREQLEKKQTTSRRNDDKDMFLT